MEFNNPFRSKGNWYKGNLHTHSNNSDGAFSSEETVSRYKKAGYNFLAITDHFVLTNVDSLSDGDILVFSGEETNPVGVSDVGWNFEFIAFNIKKSISFPKVKNPEISPQTVIDLVLAQVGEVLLAHPYQSFLTVQDILPLKGFLGIEIYNTAGYFGKAYSLIHWDGLLNRGVKTFGFATDDSHSGIIPYAGYIMVKAETFSKEAILESIRKGLFYSTTGVKILELIVEKDKVTVFTEKVKGINFIANIPIFGEMFRAKEGSFITTATYKMRGGEKYLRVECYDDQGKAAWTNPIFFS